MGIIGKTLRFVGGLAVGAGIGTVAALLVAPQSGEMSKEQIQARVDAILTAGRRASRAREDELYAAWEAELNEGQPDNKITKARQSTDEADEVARQRDKARAAAQRTEDEAREKARKELEQAQTEAQKHLERAQAELEKAEKADKG
jgi:gas vesicle protein